MTIRLVLSVVDVVIVVSLKLHFEHLQVDSMVVSSTSISVILHSYRT